MQASANPQVVDIPLTPTNFKRLYLLVATKLKPAELKKNLRQYFMCLLEPESYRQLTAAEKNLLLIGVQQSLTKPFLSAQGKKIIKAIKQDIENNGVIFLKIMTDEETPSFIDYLDSCDAEEEKQRGAEQKSIVPVFLQAGHAVNEENGAISKKDSDRGYAAHVLYRDALYAMSHNKIGKALAFFICAYQQAKKISNLNETMRSFHLNNIKANLIIVLKKLVELFSNQGMQSALQGKPSKAIVAYSNAVKVAKIIYNKTNNAELLVKNQTLLMQAYLERGKKSQLRIPINYDDTILYYRAALAVHRQIPSSFQNTDFINSLLFTIYDNLANCYIAKEKLAPNEKDKIQHLRDALSKYYLAFAAYQKMPDLVAKNNENTQRFDLLQKKYLYILFNLGSLLGREALKNTGEKAESFFQEALSLFKTIPIQSKLPIVSSNIALTNYHLMHIEKNKAVNYYNKKEYQQAIKHFNRAILYGKRIPPTFTALTIPPELRIPPDAIECLNNCLKGRADCYQQLGENYLAKKLYREAVINFIFEYYYHHSANLEVDDKKGDKLKTCAARLSESWGALFTVNDINQDDEKYVAKVKPSAITLTSKK